MTTTTMTQEDRREYERLVLPLRGRMYKKAMSMTRNPDEAEDLVQDTLVRAWRFWESFKSDTNVRSWLYTILRNTFINGYHRRGRERDLLRCVSDEVVSAGAPAAIAHSSSHPPGPEEAAVLSAQRDRILDALDSLPEDFRVAVQLADLEGLSYKEIAEVMDCPIGTVMSRIYRGRKAIHCALHSYAVEAGHADFGTVAGARPRMRVTA